MHEWFCGGCFRTFGLTECVLHGQKLECPACFQRGLTGLLKAMHPLDLANVQGVSANNEAGIKREIARLERLREAIPRALPGTRTIDAEVR